MIVLRFALGLAAALIMHNVLVTPRLPKRHAALVRRSPRR
jgi:hypothetical protein